MKVLFLYCNVLHRSLSIYFIIKSLFHNQSCSFSRQFIWIINFIHLDHSIICYSCYLSQQESIAVHWWGVVAKVLAGNLFPPCTLHIGLTNWSDPIKSSIENWTIHSNQSHLNNPSYLLLSLVSACFWKWMILIIKQFYLINKWNKLVEVMGSN